MLKYEIIEVFQYTTVVQYFNHWTR